MRKSLLRTTAAFALAATMSAAGPSWAETTLTIGMTAADIPRTSGQPDQGFEGNRFTGIPMYDALTHWDLSSETDPSVVIPGLATSWAVNPDDPTRWTFTLREGVTFHDGSPFNAEAVVWNVEKVLNEDAAHFAPDQVGATTSRMPTLRSASVIDEYTVELVTSQPDAFLPLNMTMLFMASPTHWQALYDAVDASITDEDARAAAAWTAFAADPSGTGPFMGDLLVPRERFEMVRNPDYWDPARTPTIDRVVLVPLPDANARTAALLSGQVDWIEAPAPDAIPRIVAEGNVVYSNPQPHVWPWQFSFAEGSPWLDRRVRHAANLCLNREELQVLLGGYMGIPQGTVNEGHPWWGDPSFEITYDPDAARALMEEAGFSPDNPLPVTVQTSASGSGQMQPVTMNEYIQQGLSDCYFDVTLDVIEWNTLFTNWRQGAMSDGSSGADAINVSFATMDPFFAMVRFVSTETFPPVSNNWGYFGNDEFDALIADARTSFDDAERDAALARLHARVVEEAPFLWVANDVGPRAMSPDVGGVVQPKSWFIDIAPMTMAE
jgi:ABC-type transport system substrate-binding protein